jgi:nitroreductase
VVAGTVFVHDARVMDTNQETDFGLFEAIYNCRAMRRIKPDPVDRDLIIELVEAANQGPSASNRQHDRWIALTDPDKREAMAQLNRAAVDGSYGKPQPGPKQSAFEWQYENLGAVPVHLIACLKVEGDVSSFHRGVVAGGSIWGKVQNLLLAARARGLGACPTTLPLNDRAVAKEVLGLPDAVEPFCLIPIGWPMGVFGPVTRRPIDHILHWEGYKA